MLLTADGVPSYLAPDGREWAHDRRGALDQAATRFVDPMPWAAWCDRPALRLLEVGFGWGLNSAVALDRLDALGYRGAVELVGVENDPGRYAEWPTLPPSPPPALEAWWGRLPAGVELTPHRRLTLHLGTVDELGDEVGPFDGIFLDLFSPSADPSAYNPALYRALMRLSRPGTVLTSYCVARTLKDGLAATGWRVERLRSRGRRDTLRASRPLASPPPLERE